MLLHKSIFFLEKKNFPFLYKLKNLRFLVFKVKFFRFFYLPEEISVLKTENALVLKTTILSYKSFKKIVNNFLILIKSQYNYSKKILLLKGLGFKMLFLNNQLEFKLGFSHLISLFLNNINLKSVLFKNKITIYGSDKTKIGNIINKIYSFKPSDIYKGKGFSFKYVTKKLKEIKKK